MANLQANIEKLKLCRNHLADVFHDEVSDDLFDNGNLSQLTTIIQGLENAIKTLSSRL